MDKNETSGDHSLHQERLSTFVKDEPVLKSDTSSVDREEKCIAGILSPSIVDYGNTEVEMYSPNTQINSAKEELKQVVLHHEETSRTWQETQDRSVPCEQPSAGGLGSLPNSTAVPAADVSSSPLTQEAEQRENMANKEGSDLNESLTVVDQLLNCPSNEGRSDEDVKINQDQDEFLPDDGDSCHSQYCKNVGECVDDFNQKYQEKIAPEESTTADGEFSPESFFSSIPSFNRNRNESKQEAETEKQTDKSSAQIDVQQNVSYPMRPPGLVISNPRFALMRHSGYHGVPIAPKPDPNNKVSCYILVVPAPVYYERFATRGPFPVRQEQPLVAGEQLELSNTGEPVTTPEAQVPAAAQQREQLEWTPRSVRPSRTNWLSTMMRVSPSPNNGNNSSPVITVSTTSTPIQPLCGHRQQYVIVQGNNRHLRSSASHREGPCRNSGRDNRQPIYLQGLPPQGFRRLWKSKRDSSTHGQNRRPLVPLFPKISPSLIEEATVPQIERSPLTCVRSKQPSEREVPDGTGMLSDRVAPDEQTSPQPNEQIPNTNSTSAKLREDKEKKKERERKYDAALKDGLENLKRLVPGIQRSYNRGVILQETAKHIRNLQKKIEEARNSTSTQARDGLLVTSQMREVIHNKVACKNLPEGEISQRLEHGYSEYADIGYAGYRSLVLVGAHDGAGASHGEDVEDTIIEEVPLCLPSQHLQGLSPTPRHLAPYCTSRSPQQSVSEEALSRFVPVVEVPFYTEGIEHSQLSPRSDVILSAMTTISQERLTDLGVNLSPLLSPQGIIMSPEGYLTGESNIAVLFGNRETVDTDHVNFSCCGMDEEVISGLCTDMTSIAASVEVTTDQSTKGKSLGNGIQRRSPRFRNTSASAQTVPSVSPDQVSDPKLTSPRPRNRRVLRENSNFKEPKSPMGVVEGNRRKRLKDRSPKQSRLNSDENLASVNRTPPGRVSDVILSRSKKTPSPRGGGVTKRIRRV